MKNNYQAQYEQFSNAGNGRTPVWLRDLRASAFERFSRVGLPTTVLEDWKYTNVAPLRDTPFVVASEPEAVDLSATPFEEIPSGGWESNRIVFINGHYAPSLSTLTTLPTGATVGSLAKGLEQTPELVRPYLEAFTKEASAFALLNTAFVHDGGHLFVPPGTVLEDPVHFLFLSSTDGYAMMSHPRNLIIAGADTQVTIVESYYGKGNEVYFTNGVTQIIAGENSVLDHYKIQGEGIKAFHTSALQIEQARSSQVTSHSLSLGGALVRNDVQGLLQAEGAELTLNGLTMTRDKQHVDNHTLIDHLKPHCSSRELYLGILDDKSRSVFDGKILVRPDAQKTNAKQNNRNLLLSKEALANTKPQLEIYADDVKCTHGATTGRLQEEAIFYLRSRGIEEKAARAMLTVAFANEIVHKIKIKALRKWLHGQISQRLPA